VGCVARSPGGIQSFSLLKRETGQSKGDPHEENLTPSNARNVSPRHSQPWHDSSCMPVARSDDFSTLQFSTLPAGSRRDSRQVRVVRHVRG
jgi:hypothetical protein